MIPTSIINNLNLPLKQSSLIDQTRVKVGPNLAKAIPIATLQKIYMWMLDQYIIPQIMGRRPYEAIWHVLYDAYRLRLKIKDLNLKDDEKKFLDNLIQKAKKTGGTDLNITDTLIFDTVDRMANLAHFIQWKDGTPVQYQAPQYRDTPLEDRFYHPTRDKYQAGNCVLNYFIQKEGCYRKTRLGSKDHFLYGISFILSDLTYKLEVDDQKNVILKDIGISYEPISIRKVWLNYMLPLSKMHMQPCPFYYEYASNFAILQNAYDPALNPFGFERLDELEPRFYTAFASMGEQAAREALQARLQSAGQSLSVYESQWKDVAALWTFHPMLPLDAERQEFDKYSKDYPDANIKKGQQVPYARYCWQQYGTDIIQGHVTPIRVQKCEYYGENLPIYGSTHLEDLDSAAYGMSICEALVNYCMELSKCKEQYTLNKDLVNDPPSAHTVGSPSFEADVKSPGAKYEVLSQGDVTFKSVPDVTQTTVQMCEHLRERAQTTSKVVEAIMGKAMGGRTSATEAQNIFQAAMSGVTTDINLLSFDTMGQYAIRVWDYASRWFDLDLIQAICGNYGLVATKDDLNLNISLNFAVGSTFIESIVKQQHLRYFFEAALRSPVMDQRILITAFAKEIKLPDLEAAIIPDGIEREVQIATDQVMKTFLDKQFMINPMQNHQVAMEVKMRYLEDQTSAWMVEYGPLLYQNTALTRAQVISEQIKIHQQYWQIQMMQQQQDEIANLQIAQAQQKEEMQNKAEVKQQSSLQNTPRNQGEALAQSHNA